MTGRMVESVSNNRTNSRRIRSWVASLETIPAQILPPGRDLRKPCGRCFVHESNRCAAELRLRKIIQTSKTGAKASVFAKRSEQRPRAIQAAAAHQLQPQPESPQRSSSCPSRRPRKSPASSPFRRTRRRKPHGCGRAPVGGRLTSSDWLRRLV